MENVQETLCRFCLKTITDRHFKMIDNDIEDIQSFLLLKLKLYGESVEVICFACKRKLYAALKFKTTCLDTDYTIFPYLDCKKVLQLDISQAICRLCMHAVENEFRCIREEELEAIQKLIPEMNINIIKDPVVCKECFDSLCTHNSFLREVEEKSEGIFDSQATESQIDTKPSDLCVKSVNPDEEFDINEMEMSIKSESVDRISEDEGRSDRLLQSSDNEPFENSDYRDAEEDGCKHENRSGIKYMMKTKQERNVLYRCDKCIYETGSEIHFKAHYERHMKDVKVYQCERCEYETKNKKLLQKHQLRHKDTSQVPIYRCNDCNFKTKCLSNIKRHQLKHKDSPQVLMYRCNNCDYKAKYKIAIKRHQLKHKDPSHVQMYKCNVCEYKAKYKIAIKRHQLKHKDPSQVQMYKCNNCDYEAKYKIAIKRHQLKHKDPSQVQMYKCNDCDYEAKYKIAIKRHQLKHKDPSQVQMYKCNNCDYEAKYKIAIKRHQLKHKHHSQVQMNRPNHCDHKTKYKKTIKRHQPKYKDPSQVYMYRCNDCSYKTLYSSYMKKHQLKHKDPSHVQMFRCNDSNCA